MLHVDLVDLGLFRHVVEAGSITHGAQRANLALAAASTRIRAMEDAIGAQLLVRSRLGVTPTPAGRTLLTHARTMLSQAERLREDLGAFSGGSAAEIKVLSNTNALTGFLPDLLGAFLARHPGVSVDLEERLSDEIVGLIAEGVGEIGIVAGTVETAGLEIYPFASDRFVVVAAPGHPIAERDSTTFADVMDLDFVGLDRASALQRFLAGKAARAGRVLRLRVQLRSFDAVCRMVEAGVGIVIVPETTARLAQRTSDIRVVALVDPWAVRDLTICLRSYARLPQASRLLVDLMRAGAAAPMEPAIPPALRKGGP